MEAEDAARAATPPNADDAWPMQGTIRKGQATVGRAERERAAGTRGIRCHSGLGVLGEGATRLCARAVLGT